MSEAEFKRGFVSGVSWTATSQAVTQMSIFLVTIVLARLLVPEDFGVIGMANIYVGLVAMLGEIGLGAALIHRAEASLDELSTVFWASVVVGAALTAASIACAPLAASFFRDPQVGAVIRALSITFVLSALGSVHKVLLNKRLDFRRLARVEIGSVVAYGLVAVATAAGGMGVWSLVAGYAVRAVVEAVLLWAVEPWRPGFAFDRVAFRSLFSFGANVWGFNFVNYARENVDYFVVGRVLGAGSLGLYTFSYNLANLPRKQLGAVVGRVAFPAFARVQDDDPLLCRAYVKIVRCVSLVAFPLLAGLALVAPLFVPVVYGQKWVAAVVPLQLLCGAGALYSLGSTVGSLYLAKGRPDLQLKVGLGAFALLGLAVGLGVRWGIAGVAAGVLAYTLTSLLAGQAFANGLIGLRMREYVRALVPACAGCAVMAVAVLSTSAAASEWGLRPAASLVAQILAGAVALLAALRVMRVPEYFEAWGLVRRRLSTAAWVVGSRHEPAITGREAGDAP